MAYDKRNEGRPSIAVPGALRFPVHRMISWGIEQPDGLPIERQSLLAKL